MNARTTFPLIAAAAAVIVFAGLAAQPQESAAGPQDSLVLQGHENAVGAVAFSPDGRWIASASTDHTVRLWDARTGRPGAVLRGHSDEVYAVAFSPDGRQLASTGYDRRVLLWDLGSGQVVRTLSGFPDWSITLAYSPDGKRLAVGAMDGSITLYDVASGAVVRSFKPQKLLAALAYSPDGRVVASGLASVVLSSAETGEAVRTLEGPENILSAIAFSPDGTLLAAAGWDKTVHLWKTDTGAAVRTLRPAADLPPDTAAASLTPEQKSEREEKHTLPVTGVAFSPDGKLLATAGADKTVRLWDAATGEELQRFHGHTGAVTCIAFSPDGHHLVSGSVDKTLRLWAVSLPHSRG